MMFDLMEGYEKINVIWEVEVDGVVIFEVVMMKDGVFL